MSFWVKNNTNASIDVTNEVVAGDGRGAGTPVAGNFNDTPVSETVTIPANTDWKRVEFNIDFPAVTSDQNVPKWEIIVSPSQVGAIDVLFDDFAITSGS